MQRAHKNWKRKNCNPCTSAGNHHVAGTEGGKTSNKCQTRDNTQHVQQPRPQGSNLVHVVLEVTTRIALETRLPIGLRARKQATSVKRGKTRGPFPSAGKHAAPCQARENTQPLVKRGETRGPLSSAGKHAAPCQTRGNTRPLVKRGETRGPLSSAGKHAAPCQARGNTRPLVKRGKTSC